VKPFIEKLPLSEDRSFVAQTHRTPNFEVPWHQHVEYELILFKEGAGLSFIGNYVGEFETGDIFFLGSNVPHTFQKSHAQRYSLFQKAEMRFNLQYGEAGMKVLGMSLILAAE